MNHCGDEIEIDFTGYCDFVPDDDFIAELEDIESEFEFLRRVERIDD
ncbi:MAG: hypothetical protein JST01_26160 [Cyanobacteria bacterium SZAS TMP-1]|nr:hypothetical protein [Cyanobacteria bacterium SZAS TMP-1]